jgi:hypothetical protein
MDLNRKTLRALNRPGTARTVLAEELGDVGRGVRAVLELREGARRPGPGVAVLTHQVRDGASGVEADREPAAREDVARFGGLRGYTRARCYSSLAFLVTIGVLHI